MTTPYVLWDVREWNGAIGLGTAGLPNLGSGGSAFDLDVYSVPYTYNGSPGTATYASQGGGTWQAPNPLIDWANIGGHPCNGAFTMITALGSYPGGGTSPDYAEVDVLFSTTNGSGGQFAAGQCVCFGVQNSPVDSASSGTFINTFTGSEYGLWNVPNTETANSADIYVRNQLVTANHDSVYGSYSAYRGITEVTNTISGVNEEVDGYATVDGCGSFSPASVLTDDYHFFYCGEDRRLGSSNPPPVGEPWTGVVGGALFRGCPSIADLVYWQNYFYA